MKSYVVIGLGRFGRTLARQLCKLGAEVLAMDVTMIWCSRWQKM